MEMPPRSQRLCDFVRICLKRLNDQEVQAIFGGWSAQFLHEKVEEWDQYLRAIDAGLDVSGGSDALEKFFDGLTINVETLADAIETANVSSRK